MSGAIGPSTYSQMDVLLAGASSLRNQYATLQEQTTSGLVSQTYGGLASQTSQVLDLTAATNENNAYSDTINQAQGKASAMQDALSQIGTIVSSMASAALGTTATPTSSAVSSLAQEAQQALSEVVSALNTQFGGDYVFSGADTANPPVPSPGSVTSSGMYTQIGAQVSALATTPTNPPVGTVIANTVSIAANTATGTSIFSNYLNGAGAATPPVTVQISSSQQVTLDLPANVNVGAVSDPSINGTGNAISDIIRSLSVMANTTGAMASNPDLSTLLQNASTTLTSAGATLSEEGSQIGTTQNTMTAAATANTTMQTALSTQLTNLTNVDMPTAISNLQAVNNQLEASYRVLGEMSSLNLASYL